MKRLCGMVIVIAVALALAAPAAAAPADGWSGWSWSSVVAGLGGWMDGLWRAVAGSETATDDTGDDGDQVPASPDDTASPTTEPDPTSTTEARWEIDPDG